MTGHCWENIFENLIIETSILIQNLFHQGAPILEKMQTILEVDQPTIRPQPTSSSSHPVQHSHDSGKCGKISVLILNLYIFE